MRLSAARASSHTVLASYSPNLLPPTDLISQPERARGVLAGPTNSPFRRLTGRPHGNVLNTVVLRSRRDVVLLCPDIPFAGHCANALRLISRQVVHLSAVFVNTVEFPWPAAPRHELVGTLAAHAVALVLKEQRPARIRQARERARGFAWLATSYTKPRRFGLFAHLSQRFYPVALRHRFYCLTDTGSTRSVIVSQWASSHSL